MTGVRSPKAHISLSHACEEGSREKGNVGGVAEFQTRIVGGGTALLGNQYDVSRDGRFLINTVLEDAGSPITLLQNWGK